MNNEHIQFCRNGRIYLTSKDSNIVININLPRFVDTSNVEINFDLLNVWMRLVGVLALGIISRQSRTTDNSFSISQVNSAGEATATTTSTRIQSEVSSKDTLIYSSRDKVSEWRGLLLTLNTAEVIDNVVRNSPESSLLVNWIEELNQALKKMLNAEAKRVVFELTEQQRKYAKMNLEIYAVVCSALVLYSQDLTNAMYFCIGNIVMKTIYSSTTSLRFTLLPPIALDRYWLSKAMLKMGGNIIKAKTDK